MDHTFRAFFDEMNKIAVCNANAGFMKSRKGRRPIRAHNLLKKETAFKVDQTVGTAEQAKDYEHEYGLGFQE